MARILLLGSTGFVGRGVAHKILDGGHQLRVLVRDPMKAAAFKVRGAQVVVGDALNPQAVTQAAQGTEHIISLIAVRRNRPQSYLAVNVDGPRMLGEAAKAAGVRSVVFISAIGSKLDQRSREHDHEVPRWHAEQLAPRARWICQRPEQIEQRAHAQFLPYRRHIAVTGTFPAVPRNSPMTVDFQTSLYFHPEGEGVLIGMSDRAEGPGYATDVNWEFLEKMFEQAARRAPALAGAGIKTAWAGLYESTPDHQAILGPVPEVEGFWCAAGFSGHGFMQAPAAALLLAQLLLDHDSEVDISPFAFTRFAKGSLVHERNVI